MTDRGLSVIALPVIRDIRLGPHICPALAPPASRLASMRPVREGVYAHRVTVRETGDQQEQVQVRGHLHTNRFQPPRLSMEETRLPWAWLHIEVGPHRGEEYRIEGDLMGLGRPGHQLIVVSEDDTGRPLFIENLTTGQRGADDDPHPFRKDGSSTAWLRMIGCFAFLGAVLLTIPLLFPWLWLATNIAEWFGGSLDDDRFAVVVMVTPLVAALTSVLGAQLYDRWETDRRARRRNEIMRSRDALMGDASIRDHHETEHTDSTVSPASHEAAHPRSAT